MEIEVPGSGWDRMGICVSGLCVVHCVGLPLLFTMAPFLGSLYSPDEAVHRGLTLLALPIGGAALWPGYRAHGRLAILLQGLAGLTIMLAAPLLHGLGPESLEQLCAAAGALLLVGAHILNQKQRCSACPMAGPNRRNLPS